MAISIVNYGDIHSHIVGLLESSRQAAARSVNALMTATYWEIGRSIVEFEQDGAARAIYGDALIRRLASDLTARFGRGYSIRNIEQMRRFYLAWPIAQTLSAQLAGNGPALAQRAVPVSSSPQIHAPEFPLPWSAYVRLLSVKSAQARNFYETEALRGGWSVRQLDRQINSQFYERTALSKNKSAMLVKGEKPIAGDTVSADEEIRNPLVLEFLGLKDEYSESELEDALIRHLETFLLELGNEFAFVGRQKRVRIGNEWFRVDLLFFHRRLRCLVIIDLKIAELVHTDIGQMNLYCNFAREHWMQTGENPPVGLILCAGKDDALARYAMEGLHNKMLVREYLTALPKEAE